METLNRVDGWLLTFELDVPLLLEWPDGRRDALIFIVEHESDPGRFSITRLASYCLAVAEATGTTRIVPVVIFMRDGQNIPQSITLGSERNANRRRKYIDFIDIYAALDEQEQQLYKELYAEEGKQMMAMKERFVRKGRQQGQEEGRLDGRQQTLMELLAERFGPLDAAVSQRVTTASLDELRHWTRQILTARTLDDVFRLQ